uniref:Uncharacterized protein n=1 Tax=Myotis myotis TaxID=51298 RepID=A0A7J8ANG0_MYOMY|nr:hypothetical protein mMyoMyo1_008204 [Myotis myotis]
MANPHHRQQPHSEPSDQAANGVIPVVLLSSTNGPGSASNPSGPVFEPLVACKRTSKAFYGSPCKSLPSRQGKDGECLDGTEWVSLLSLSHARHGLWHPAGTQQTSVDPVSVRHTIANSRNTIQTSLNEKWLPHLASPCAAAGTAESRSPPVSLRSLCPSASSCLPLSGLSVQKGQECFDTVFLL